MKKEWGVVISPIKDFLDNIDSSNLISIFTYNGDIHNEVFYKSPSCIKTEIEQDFACSNSN